VARYRPKNPFCRCSNRPFIPSANPCQAGGGGGTACRTRYYTPAIDFGNAFNGEVARAIKRMSCISRPPPKDRGGSLNPI